MLKHGVELTSCTEFTPTLCSDAFVWDNKIGYADIDDTAVIDAMMITTDDGGTTYKCPQRVDIFSRRNGGVYHFEIDAEFMDGEQIRCVAYKLCDFDASDRRTKRIVVSLERE